MDRTLPQKTAVLDNKSEKDVSPSSAPEFETLDNSVKEKDAASRSSNSSASIRRRTNLKLPRNNSHPFFVSDSDEGSEDLGRFGNRHKILNWIANRACDIVGFLIHYSWDVLHVILHPVLALLTALFTFLDHHHHEDLHVDGKNVPYRPIRGDNDEELINLMETQTETLLEVNKFLREEVILLKEERDAAELLLCKVEERCRNATGQKEKITGDEIMDVIYGRRNGASTDSGKSVGVKLAKTSTKTADRSRKIS